MNMNGWDQLNCEYFSETCRKALSAYLEEIGFTENKETVIGGVVYTRFDLFLEISYDTAAYPTYTAKSVIGFGEGAYDKAGGFSGVPMWYILPKDHPYRTKIHWTFKTKEELTKVLEELKEEFLETTLKPLLLNREGLERVIGSFHSEFC